MYWINKEISSLPKKADKKLSEIMYTKKLL